MRAPGDKSITQRVLLLGALAGGTTHIENALDSADCRATADALLAMGVGIERTELAWQITGRSGDLDRPDGILGLQNSGTGLRLLCGLLAGQSFRATLDGDQSLRCRPMDRVVEPLRQMGAGFDSERLPLTVTGNPALCAIDYRLPVASAQVKSAILLAALQAHGTTCIVEPTATRDHTERMLGLFGVAVRRDGIELRIDGGQTPTATRVPVAGDFSSAAFMIVAAAACPGSDVVIEGVGLNPTRTGVLAVLRKMGSDISVSNERVAGNEPVSDLRVRGRMLTGAGAYLGPEQVPRMIDELPALCIAAATAAGRTEIRGASELRFKESDRIDAMTKGLKILGVTVESFDDGLVIEGGGLNGGRVDSQSDHRVAMAFSIAGALAREPVVVQDTNCIATSYPDFVTDLSSLGVAIEPTDQNS